MPRRCWEGCKVRIDLLLDGGTTRFAKGSTIVRVRAAGYSMIREGVLDAGVVQRMAILRILFVCTGTPVAVRWRRVGRES